MLGDLLEHALFLLAGFFRRGHLAHRGQVGQRLLHTRRQLGVGDAGGAGAEAHQEAFAPLAQGGHAQVQVVLVGGQQHGQFQAGAGKAFDGLIAPIDQRAGQFRRQPLGLLGVGGQGAQQGVVILTVAGGQQAADHAVQFAGRIGDARLGGGAGEFVEVGQFGHGAPSLLFNDFLQSGAKCLTRLDLR